MSERTWTAERVTALRTRLGLTQAQFAARVGCGQTTVSMWEAGERHPAGLYAAALDRLDREPGRVPGMDARQLATILKADPIDLTALVERLYATYPAAQLWIEQGGGLAGWTIVVKDRTPRPTQTWIGQGATLPDALRKLATALFGGAS